MYTGEFNSLCTFQSSAPNQQPWDPKDSPQEKPSPPAAALQYALGLVQHG